MKTTIVSLFLLVSNIAQADSFIERVKVTGFHCDYGKVAIELRSFEQNRVLFLAENESGDPKYFDLPNNQCAGLVKNLDARLTGQVFELDFSTEQFSRTEEVFIPPNNPCEHGHTKCDDGYSVEKTFEYLRTEATVDGYRFFDEQRVTP